MSKNPNKRYLMSLNLFRSLPGDEAGMSKRIFGFIGCIICLWLVVNVTSADNIPGYITLSRLAQKYNLKHEKDFLTGREVFSGNGYNIIAASGMSTIMVNSKLSILENKLISVNGQLAISQRDYSQMEDIFNRVPEIKQIIKPVKAKLLLRKVVIDPGHGGNFRGCKSRDGLKEKDVNLDLAKRLRDLLEDEGVEVVMTRTTDRSLSSNLNEDLSRRVAISNREAPDLFVSIHCI